MFYNWHMTDAFVKLQEIAVNMHLEPAEETNLSPAPEVAPCGQVVAPRSSTAQPRHTAAKQAALGI